MKRIDLAYMGRSSAAPVHIAACDKIVNPSIKLLARFELAVDNLRQLRANIFDERF